MEKVLILKKKAILIVQYVFYGINLQDIKAPKILECGDSLYKECLKDLIKRENKLCLYVKKKNK